MENLTDKEKDLIRLQAVKMTNLSKKYSELDLAILFIALSVLIRKQNDTDVKPVLERSGFTNDKIVDELIKLQEIIDLGKNLGEVDEETKAALNKLID